MKKPIGFLLSLLLLIPLNNANATVHTIHVGNFYFTPDSVLVNPGDTVSWVLDGGVHTTTSDGASPKIWDSGLLGGTPFQLQFTLADGPGPFPFHCSVHPLQMSGAIYMSAPPGSPLLIPFLLDESQENLCAGSGSSAHGYGLAILSSDSTNLSLFVKHDVDSLTGAHIHKAAPCTDGPIVFPFASPASPISQGFAVSPTDVADLLAGNLYVNIHSVSSPSGEIRGQIVPTAIKYLFTMDESQEVPPTESFSNGCAMMELSSDGTEFSVYIEHDVGNAINGHIHKAPPGMDGSPIFTFTNPLSPVNETWDLDTIDIKNLYLDSFYVNIHSMAQPGGEIRGQIVRESVYWVALMDGAQADAGNGTGSTHKGFGVLQLSADLKQLDIHIEHDIPTDSVINAHVHLGAAGVSGPPVFPFTTFSSPIIDTWELTPTDLDNLLAGDLYINLHTSNFTGGEIRGQVLKQEIEYSFFLDESQEALCVGTGSPALGFALTTLKPWGKQLNAFCEHDVVDPVNAHIHLAPNCANGPPVFPFTSFTSPMIGIWYLGRIDMIDMLGQQLYLNIHTPSFPDGEIRGQLQDCCVGTRGDINYDGSVTPNILDLNYIINYIFRFGPRPRCREEADVNSDGASSNILDLNYLVNYIFRLGPLPGKCN